MSGLPFHAADKHIQMVHAHFEGAQPKGEAKTFNPVKCQGDPGAYLIYAPLGQQSDYINVKVSRDKTLFLFSLNF